MIFKSKDFCEVLKVQNVIDQRIDNFFNKHSNLLKTSDLGFEYIKKEA